MKRTFIKKLAGALACCLLAGSIFGACPALAVRAQEAEVDTSIIDEVTTESSETQLPEESSARATTTYTLTVNGGLGSGSYPAGMRVSIIAEKSADGEAFDQWTVVSGDITLADITSKSTYFTMPESDVEITATYKHAHALEWVYDEAVHCQVCACGYKTEESTHTAGFWITDVEATDTVVGAKHTECSSCGKTMQTKDVYLAPEIVTQPVSLTVHIGEVATFTVDAAGTNPSYQWQYRPSPDSTTYKDIEGAVQATYTIDVVNLWDHQYKYRCVVTNPAGEVTSSAASLTVLDNRPVRILNLNVNGSIIGITDPIAPADRDSLWQGTKVYFGSFDADTDTSAEPILFRVLDAATTAYSGHSMFLDCDTIISTHAITYTDEQAARRADDSKSSLKTWLNRTSIGNFLEAFTLAEQSSLSGSTNAKVFALSLTELSNTSYGYHEDISYPSVYKDNAVTNRIKYNASGQTNYYWTRTTHPSGAFSWSLVLVTPEGNFIKAGSSTSYAYGVSPALNLSLDSVLFAGTCDMDKTAPLSAVALALEDTNVWTLTLKDITKTVALQDGCVASLHDATGLVTVPYVYYGNGINQISVMITSAPRTEDTAEILYYGRLETENSFDTATGSGTGTFTLPADLPEGYEIYLLAEEVREGNYTDSASEPFTLHLTYTPVLPEADSEDGMLNGIHQADDFEYYYYVNNEVDTAVNGLVCHDVDGKWYYFENGKLISTKYDIVEFGEAKYFVANGCLQNDASNSGLQLIGDNFYYLAYGQLQEQYTGLVLYDGQWFYVENGVLVIDFHGLQDYDGSKFLISYGQIRNDYTGLYYDTVSGNWYYIVYGQVQTDYTGLVLYDGAWFYLENGKLASDFTGTVEYDGAQFEVYCGQVVTG